MANEVNDLNSSLLELFYNLKSYMYNSAKQSQLPVGGGGGIVVIKKNET